MNKITQYLLYISVVATPLIFSSSFSNFYDIPKIAVLAFSVSAALLFFALRTLLSGRLKLSVSNFDVPIIILALSYLVSATLAGAVSLLAISGILAKIPQLPAFVKDASFPPLEGFCPRPFFWGW